MGAAAARTDKARQLREDGFCVLDGVLTGEDLARTQSLAEKCVADISPEHRAKWRSEGSLVHVGDHPEFADLIAFQPALRAMADLRLDDVRFSSGYVISKPPKGPALFWHQDWWGWNDPLSLTDRICQVFLFYYLTDTRPENGCLRVIPGSHRRRNRLHDLLDAHSADLATADDATAEAFASSPAEFAVPLRAGDLVIGDARLLHGSYPNASDDERTLITLWYHPGFAARPAPFQTRVWGMHHRAGADTDPGGLGPLEWPEPARGKLRGLTPEPAAAARGAEPQPWNRQPMIGCSLRPSFASV